MSSSLVFAPLLPIWVIILLGIGILIITAMGSWRGLQSFTLRLVAAFILIGALLNPQKLFEQRQPLDDIVIVLVDRSLSMDIQTRRADTVLVQQALQDRLETLGQTQTVFLPINATADGTNLMQSLIDGLAQYPSNRIAGVFAITDGQVHDIPAQIQKALPDGVPFHGLIIGDKSARDRRISAIETPRFGLVGEHAEFKIKIEDIGHEGERAPLEIKLNGETVARFAATIGDVLSLPVPIDKRGANTIEIRVAEAEGEISKFNNMFVSEISGVRDRLRVLLVTGEPHMGGRAWRNLLKSDPSVDLVQFTILTNPGKKNTGARTSELSLIRFPDRELFEDKLREFDLVIFDHFKRRTVTVGGRSRPMLNPIYIANIAQYVENGGALLVATGPAFAGDESLARSPLISVLPARPTGEMSTGAFRPRLNTKGTRHPITSIFNRAGPNGAKQWGKWYRTIDAEIIGGDVIMTRDDGTPLLIIDKIKKGRTALLLSDQAWLWARGHDGGGPYNEIFRRLSHWLMGEPDLEADRLLARIENQELIIDQYSLDDEAKTVTITSPDGTAKKHELTRMGDGHFNTKIKADQHGAYSLVSGDLAVIAAAMSLNPKEYKHVLPTDELIKPLVDLHHGGLYWMGHGLTASTAIAALPSVQKSAKNKKSNNQTARLVAREQSHLTASRREPIGPSWIYFLLILLALLGAWWREGR